MARPAKPDIYEGRGSGAGRINGLPKMWQRVQCQCQRDRDYNPNARVSDVRQTIQLLTEKCHRHTPEAVGPKNFVVGCLTLMIIFLCAILIPVVILFFKLSLLIAIPIGIIAAVILAVTVIGHKVGNRWVCVDYASLLEQGRFGDTDEANLMLAVAGRIHAARIAGQEHFDDMEESHQRMLAAVLSVILYHRS